MFVHLFGKPTEDKLALVCTPKDRDPAMLDVIVSRLQNVPFFQDFPRSILEQVAANLEYEVVACGKCFALGEEHPHNFYVLLNGRISVRRKFGDFASSVTTHHLDVGVPFGCTGHMVSSSSKLLADESSEIGILWPDSYDATIRAYCTDQNNQIFQFLQQLKAFRHFSTSELGHIIGISERKRFRKGELVLDQNESPQYLGILRKGTCLMYQDFTMPPLRGEAEARRNRQRNEDSNDQRVLPFHRLLARPDWPLGFHVDNRHRKKRKQGRGRRNALMEHHMTKHQTADMMLLAARASSTASLTALAAEERPITPHALSGPALITTLCPGAIFGEATFHDQQNSRSKCSIVADSVVEVLLFDHLRLQDMELSPDVIKEILQYAPEYMEEDQVLKHRAEEETWNEYKNLRMLEVSKTRWPESKKHLRVLSNGCSIMLNATQ
ncbi:hypothetical protein Poli38472_005821 [Pythium oligandrum]|uniref:Cyclic nucleotide-binding domain-containing protein n=1 Tax=Pythium oligandrum TaxID=41045 RepID=A0A8K1FSA0_PYTOL|nr:hypothetical protein Poli38472_005821 [Pythium oligandrum]|eukprot:TMW68353.1 hypothetical protein Poli38472_005821 [Pythium oligandrum]